jgi:hypothetical protein
MEKKLRLRLILRLLRAAIDVLEVELNRQIEKGIRNENWFENLDETGEHSSRSRSYNITD